MNIERERKRERKVSTNHLTATKSFTRILPDETTYRWHGDPYKRSHGLADIFPTSCLVPLEPPDVPSQSIISSMSWHGCSTLDTRRSSPPTMIGQGERRRRGEEGDVEKGDRYIPVFVALSSRPHAAGPVDTQLCVATRPRHEGGRG